MSVPQTFLIGLNEDGGLCINSLLAASLRNSYGEVHGLIATMPEGRARSIALTKLEESFAVTMQAVNANGTDFVLTLNPHDIIPAEDDGQVELPLDYDIVAEDDGQVELPLDDDIVGPV